MPTNRSPLRLIVIVALVCGHMTLAARAGTKVTVGRVVPQSQRISMDKVNHVTWDRLLNKYVDGNGRVNYAAWQRSSADTTALDGYLNELSRANTKARGSRDGKLAFWINAYNAVTIKGILREYPTSSIRNHTAKLYGYNIWHDLLLIVGDAKISLNDIEHEVLRKSGEPRIHFAIVCASQSCPRLLNQAYTGSKLEQQLSANTKAFFANAENFRYSAGTFQLSSILKWFSEDFGGSQAELLKAISPYLPDRASQQAASSGSGRILYFGYDWSLNDQATTPNITP